jgi:hypothetical protein
MPSALKSTFVQRTKTAVDAEQWLQGMEDTIMPRAKQASKRKAGTKAVPVLGAAGLSLSLAGGASATTSVPVADMPAMNNLTQGHEITLAEEEIADVSLATFYVFDKENTGALESPIQGALESPIQLARGGCGGCRGCGGRGCGGCRGCGGGCRGCFIGGCGGCGCGCCLSWGACRWC